MPKIKNIIIFLTIAAVFILIYIFFIKSPTPAPSLVSSSPTSAIPKTASATVAPDSNSPTAQDFLNLLLNVKNLKLDDAIFSDNAFTSLRDSSITLIPDGNEGRINPFAPIGIDAVEIVPPICVLPKVLNTLTNTCVDPLSN